MTMIRASGAIFFIRSNQSQIIRTHQEFIGNSGDHDLGLVNTGVLQCFRVADVAINDLDAVARQAAQDLGVKIHHDDLVFQLDLGVLDLLDKSAGDPKEPQQGDFLRGRRWVVGGPALEILEADTDHDFPQ